MAVIADTHVHIYPFYRVEVALRAGIEALEVLAGKESRAPLALCLTERSDCTAFQREWEGVHDRGTGYLCFRRASGRSVFIFSGFQIATCERLEVLALCSTTRFPDGEPIEVTVDRVLQSGTVPVVPWSFGKWLRCGKRVSELIAEAAPGSLLVGDTALRSKWFPDPRQFQLAKQRGIGLIAGTDPLPIRGEEFRIGRYATRIEAELQEVDPVGSMQRMLRSEREKFQLVGSPLGVFPAMRRVIPV